MTAFQKVIKYVAIAFATFLSINIILAMCFALTLTIGAIGKVSGEKDHYIATDEVISYTKTYEGITNVKIESGIAKMKIVKGDKFKVEATKELKIEQKGNNVKIVDKFKHKHKVPQIIVHIPNELDSFSLEAGSGDILIEDVVANKLDIEIGAGNFVAKNIVAKAEANIEGGAGKVVIEQAILNELDLDAGMGDFELNGQLIGRSKIEVGVGRLTIDLQDRDYTIYAEKGIGRISVDGKNVGNNVTVGEGKNKLYIDAGIGSIEVNFK